MPDALSTSQKIITKAPFVLEGCVNWSWSRAFCSGGFTAYRISFCNNWNKLFKLFWARNNFCANDK